MLRLLCLGDLSKASFRKGTINTKVKLRLVGVGFVFIWSPHGCRSKATAIRLPFGLEYLKISYPDHVIQTGLSTIARTCRNPSITYVCTKNIAVLLTHLRRALVVSIRDTQARPISTYFRPFS